MSSAGVGAGSPAHGVGGLYCLALGHGPPVIVLHGGPDFDHSYLRPELDRLGDFARLVYYDQRGRGRSSGDPNEVGIGSEVADVDHVRRQFGFETVVLLGHSWGGLLAMEYTVRYPSHVSGLILANTAPASAVDARAFREHLLRIRPHEDVARLGEITSSAAHRAGDLVAEAEYYRIHFQAAVTDPDLVERIVSRLRQHYTAGGVLDARVIEQRLYDETWRSDGYDLVPKLAAADVPTLVVHGEHDFVPLALASRIADAVPKARLAVLDCGHFAYLEQPEAFAAEIESFLSSAH